MDGDAQSTASNDTIIEEVVVPAVVTLVSHVFNEWRRTYVINELLSSTVTYL